MEESVKKEIEWLLVEQVRLDKLSSILNTWGELYQTKRMLEPDSFWENFGEAERN